MREREREMMGFGSLLGAMFLLHRSRLEETSNRSSIDLSESRATGSVGREEGEEGHLSLSI